MSQTGVNPLCISAIPGIAEKADLEGARGSVVSGPSSEVEDWRPSNSLEGGVRMEHMGDLASSSETIMVVSTLLAGAAVSSITALGDSGSGVFKALAVLSAVAVAILNLTGTAVLAATNFYEKQLLAKAPHKLLRFRDTVKVARSVAVRGIMSSLPVFLLYIVFFLLANAVSDNALNIYVAAVAAAASLLGAVYIACMLLHLQMVAKKIFKDQK
ncbi:hypothetical protein B484DRAFT_443880, partial [Ochromonadaceae sp. CCMP2298]|mmetsp:Transcript_32274/g.71081  ORF Transcript_32274/g.71081 Transcript_32274/m.71081 type:complete len:214 (+) Transcript_32274:49-690(+)